MPRPKPTAEDIERRKMFAQEVKCFMREKLYTEVKLAESLELSRRTVQMWKAGLATPTPKARRRWEALRAKYTPAPSLPLDTEA